MASVAHYIYVQFSLFKSLFTAPPPLYAGRFPDFPPVSSPSFLVPSSSGRSASRVLRGALTSPPPLFPQSLPSSFPPLLPHPSSTHHRLLQPLQVLLRLLAPVVLHRHFHEAFRLLHLLRLQPFVVGLKLLLRQPQLLARAANTRRIIIITEMAVFNVAGYLTERRRKQPVITASPRGQYSK